MESGAFELLNRANELMDRRRDEEAVPLLELANMIQPSKGSILETLGRAYFNTGRRKAARASFEQCLEVDPTNHFAHFCLALCLKHLNLRQQAIGHLKLALVMKPQEDRYADALRRLVLAPEGA